MSLVSFFCNENGDNYVIPPTNETQRPSTSAFRPPPPYRARFATAPRVLAAPRPHRKARAFTQNQSAEARACPPLIYTLIVNSTTISILPKAQKKRIIQNFVTKRYINENKIEPGN